MSAQIADFRRAVQTTNQANAKALHEKLTAERAPYFAETSQFIGEMQADSAGVAAGLALVVPTASGAKSRTVNLLKAPAASDLGEADAT